MNPIFPFSSFSANPCQTKKPIFGILLIQSVSLKCKKNSKNLITLIFYMHYNIFNFPYFLFLQFIFSLSFIFLLWEGKEGCNLEFPSSFSPIFYVTSFFLKKKINKDERERERWGSNNKKKEFPSSFSPIFYVASFSLFPKKNK